MSDLLQVTDRNIHEALKAPRAAVEFWADWCHSCKRAAPSIDRLAKELKGQVLVVGANVDQVEKFSEKHNVSSVPVIVLFKNGKEVHRIEGVPQYRKLLQEILCKFNLR
jgi:thioredoxin 1